MHEVLVNRLGGLSLPTCRAFHVFRTKGLKPAFPTNKSVQVFGVICRFIAYTISDRYQLVFDILLT